MGKRYYIVADKVNGSILYHIRDRHHRGGRFALAPDIQQHQLREAFKVFEHAVKRVEELEEQYEAEEAALQEANERIRASGHGE